MEKPTSVQEFFRRMAPEKIFANEVVLAQYGAKRLKRSLLGLCGSTRTMTSQELASTFYELGAVSNLSDGRDFVPKLIGQGHPYTNTKELEFRELSDRDGKKMYEVEAKTTPDELYP